MKNIFTLKKEIVLITLIIIPIVFLATYWSELPAELPSHWNVKGEVDGYSPKYTMPLIGLGLYCMLLLLPLIDPKKKNYEFFTSTYFKIRLIMVLFFSAISCLVMANALGYDIPINQMVMPGVMILFIFLGNIMSTIKSNWFVGIRTPWTLANDVVWKKTHALAGKLWFGSGLIGLVMALALPSVSKYTLLILLSIMVLVPIIYSYVIFKKLKKGE